MGKWNARALGAQPKEKQDEFWKYFEKLVRMQEKDAKIPPGGAGCRTEPAEGIVVIYDFDGFRFNHNVTVEGNQGQNFHEFIIGWFIQLFFLKNHHYCRSGIVVQAVDLPSKGDCSHKDGIHDK